MARVDVPPWLPTRHELTADYKVIMLFQRPHGEFLWPAVLPVVIGELGGVNEIRLWCIEERGVRRHSKIWMLKKERG